MTNSKKTVWWLIAIVAILLVIWGVTNKGTSSVDNGPIKIGAMVPLTGDAATYGEGAKNVYQLAVEEINSAGGINGRQVQLIIEDSKCNGKDATNAAQKLINVDGVKVIIGGFCSSESLSTISVAEGAKVALFSPGSSSPDLTGKSAYFFRNYPSDSSQGSTIAQVVYDQGMRKVAFLQEQTDYPLGVYKAFVEKFQSLGGTVLKEEFPTGAKDFRSALSKLKAEKPDALFINTQTPAVSETVIKQFASLGWKVQLLINDATAGDTKTIAANATVLEGAIAAEFGVDITNEKFKHLTSAYKQKYGSDLPYQSYGQTEYDAFFMLKDAIEAVGYDGTKIATWGHQVTNWQGASGSVTIGSNGDRIGGHRAEIVKNGKIEAYTK
jgi:branched-chain amino acid transport system substrate-binding protein